MPPSISNPLKRRCRRVTAGPVFAAMLAVLTFVGVDSVAGGQPPPRMPLALKHESRHEIDQLEEAWRAAILKSNTAEMDRLLADDYMAITSTGTLQTKQQALDNLRSGRTHFTQLEISDRKVRFYGTTALVTSVAVVRATTGEGDISGSYRYIRVYVRDPKGAWKIVSFEVSRIRDPGERAEHKQ